MRTNSKAVRDQVKSHILGFMSIEDIKGTLQNLQTRENKSIYHRGVEMVMGGTFLVYYEDVKNFLNSLGINPNNKEYTDQRSWDLYKHLIASEIEKLVK